MTDKKIVDYIIVVSCGSDQYSNSGPIDLCNKVKEYVKNGYIPLGNPFIEQNQHGSTSPYFQAMVKYEDDKEPPTKDFNDYAKKRLTESEIKEIEEESQKEFKIEKWLNTPCDSLDECGIKEATGLDYLRELLLTLIEENERFSGKRPFGNSDWIYDIAKSLMIQFPEIGNLDEDGYIEKVDDEAVQNYTKKIINYIFRKEESEK